jgi:hypothetical protein
MTDTFTTPNPFADIDSALHGGSKSFFNKYSEPGDTITGTIAKVDVKQATNYKTGELEFFPSGDPKKQVILTLQTSLREDADDDGKRSVYIPLWGGKKAALGEAMRAAGMKEASTALALGNTFTARFVGEERKHGQTGSYTEKIYEYAIQAASTAALNEAMTPAAPVAPAAAPAPASQPTAPAAQAPQQVDVPALIRAGLDDQSIASAAGLDASVVAQIRASL